MIDHFEEKGGFAAIVHLIIELDDPKELARRFMCLKAIYTVN
jgi:hypothetical protein